jgi:hypothetical protein
MLKRWFIILLEATVILDVMVERGQGGRGINELYMYGGVYAGHS